VVGNTKRQVIGQLKLESSPDDFLVSLEGAVLDETKMLLYFGINDLSVLLIERRNASM
jgi:hypothetical protein